MIDIGRYQEIYKDEELPSITAKVSDEPCTGKDIILKHLKSGKTIALSPAFLTDVMTGEHLPEVLSYKTDGKYGWRSDITYYFERYNIKLPDDFIEYCLANDKRKR